ncbi:MAG: hypothetical protein NC433_02135 [Clostridiales bacterium]|nr:hypothetical protein [Clostridiales bacterium]
MRKKVLTLMLAAALFVSTLVGCGNAAEPAGSNDVANDGADAGETAESTEAECGHEWAEATCTEPKTCSKCGETEGQALGHTWMEATFAAPKTCSVCGETEGTVKQSYFEEHGIEVADAPVACTVDAVIFDWDNYEQYQMTTDCVWEQLDCYSEPAEEEGYQLVHLDLLATYQLYYDGAQGVNYTYSSRLCGMYDWYTGRKLPDRAMLGDDAYDVGVTLEVDGISYDVSYSHGTRSEQDDWVLDDNGNATSTMRGYGTYTFKVPDGYDGLVFVVAPQREYTGDLDTETIDDSEGYAADLEAQVDGSVYFRINKEGTVPERLPEDSADTTAE